MSIIWIHVSIGSLPLSGDNSLVDSLQQDLPTTVPMALQINSWVFTFCSLAFAFIAIITSYITNAKSLMDFIDEIVILTELLEESPVKGEDQSSRRGMEPHYRWVSGQSPPVYILVVPFDLRHQQTRSLSSHFSIQGTPQCEHLKPVKPRKDNIKVPSRPGNQASQGCNRKHTDIQLTHDSSFSPDTIVRHPDAPMLIIEVKGEYAKVAIYSQALKLLIEAGWVELKVLEGWTVFKHNWETKKIE